MEISKELIGKAKACTTVEDLMALAKANEIELSVEDANLLLKDFAEGELADAELENVAGGADGGIKPGRPHKMVLWNTREEVQFIFNVGDSVQAFGFWGLHHTATCIVTDRCVEEERDMHSFYDMYYLKKVEGCRTPFINSWRKRDEIEE